MAAFALTAVMGMSGLAVEVSNGYSIKVRNQRVADMAALGAAQAYQTNQSVAAAIQVANDIVVASGLPLTAVQASSGTVNGVSAIQVTVTNEVPIALAKAVMNSASYNVSSYAAASLTSSSAPGCITALSGSVTYGVSLTGGTQITANGCAVLTNSGISATIGTKISAKQVVAGKTINDVAALGGGTPGITTTPTANNIKANKSGAASDTVGTDPRVVAGFAKVGNFTTPTAPAAGAQAWSFDYHPTGQLAGWWNSNTSTYTVPAGTYDVTSISTGGGLKIVVQDGAVIRVSGNVVLSSPMTMGAVTLDIGGQLNVGSGLTMTVASGNVAIGSNASGNAITIGGGSVLSFGDGLFSANGSIVTGGNSHITFGATANHYINGALSLNGYAVFGAGAYYINGAFTNSTGGTISGSGVTFFMSGTLGLGGGAITNLAAPTSDAGGGVTDLLFATKSTTQTSLSQGATGSYGGMVYAPNSNMVMSGGASAGNTGRCFSLVVNTLTLSGGTTAGTACTSLGSSGASNGVSLLQ
ncbi:MAG: hypothetical protein JF628_08195 [Sphingomonas sp.]|nr:hypothetical protein [Sphingomonas sp.]